MNTEKKLRSSVWTRWAAVLIMTFGFLSPLPAGERDGPFRMRFAPAGVASLKRSGDRYDTEYIAPGHNLGHLSVRYRMPGGDWTDFSTLEVPKARRRAQDPPGAEVNRHSVSYNQSGWDDYFADLEAAVSFRVEGDALYWTIHLRNLTHKPLELGDVVLPLPFNGEARWDKTEMYTRRVTSHRMVSGHGSFLFWMRPNGEGPFLVMTPMKECPLFESNRNERNFRPARLEYVGRRGVFLHSAASGAEDAARGGNWRQPQTSHTLSPKYSPNDEVTWMFKFRWADDYDGVRDVLYEEGLFDIKVVPGMTVPVDLEARLALRTRNRDHTAEPEFPEETRIELLEKLEPDVFRYSIRFSRLGENKLTLLYGNGLYTVLEFFVTQELETMMRKRAGFLVRHQQHRDPSKWYNGLFSEWDMRSGILRGPDDTDGMHRYVLSCDDPGLCKAPYIAAKNVYYPEIREIEAVEYYIEHFVWGGLQQTDQEAYPYGVYGIPDWKVNRESEPSDPEGWTGHVWRTFDYPHVINLYWSMHRVAARYPELTRYLDADGYLERAYGTAVAYFTWPLELAGWPAEQVGNFDELVIPGVIDALESRGRKDKAARLRGLWEGKVEHFVNDRPNLFHSEFPFDPTGFESHHAFAAYAAREAGRPGGTLAVTPEAARNFMEEEIRLNIAVRGWLETAYHLLGSERNLRYMAQMGGWAVLDYGLYYAQDPFPYLRLGYASFLSSWALMNSGTKASGYGFWYPGKAHDGAAGSAFVSSALGRNWLGFEQPRGPWFYSAEIDLGFGGALRTAATVATEDPLFGWYALGGELERRDGTLQVVPRDGLRVRFHVIREKSRFHLLLDQDGFADGRPITIDLDRGEVRFFLESRGGGRHETGISLKGLSPGKYELMKSGGRLRTFAVNQGEKARLVLPVGDGRTSEFVVRRIQEAAAARPNRSQPSAAGHSRRDADRTRPDGAG